MTFVCVNDRAHEEMLGPLRDASRSRGVSYRQVDALEFDFDPAARLSNFPCNVYWAEIAGGIPAGPMLDHLIAKAGRLASPQAGK